MINILYPEKCPGCNKILSKNDDCFCEKCQKVIATAMEPVCMCCGKPLENKAKEYCNSCTKKRTEYLTANRASFVYDGPVRDALYRLKYSGASYVGKQMTKKLYEDTKKWVEHLEIKYVVPVPVSKDRLRKRGYNQAEIIAKEYIKRYNKNHKAQKIELLPVVTRSKNTAPQKELTADIRRKNLKRAFKLDKSVVELERMYHYVTKYDSILLVDDIFTTGATLDTISNIILDGNLANRIYSITLAVGRDI